MKFKKVSQKDVSTGLPTVIGAGAGVMVARGISGVVVKDEAGVPLTDDQKKKKLYVALALLAGGAYGFMAIEGNDTVATATKGLALGAALNGVLDVVSHLADKSPAKPDTTTTTGKFIASALACPCDTVAAEKVVYVPTLQMPRSLRMPEIQKSTLVDLQNFSSPVKDLLQVAS